MTHIWVTLPQWATVIRLFRGQKMCIAYCNLVYKIQEVMFKQGTLVHLRTNQAMVRFQVWFCWINYHVSTRCIWLMSVKCIIHSGISISVARSITINFQSHYFESKYFIDITVYVCIYNIYTYIYIFIFALHSLTLPYIEVHCFYQRLRMSSVDQ